MTAVTVPRRRSPALTAATVAAVRFTAGASLLLVGLLAFAAVAPAAAGWEPLVITGGSMKPTIPVGSVVVAQPPSDGQLYAAPTIIAFADGSSTGGVTTHRITDTESDPSAGGALYTTRGDANRDKDTSPVRHEDLVGAVRYVVPHIGTPVLWARGGRTAPLLLSAAAVTASAVVVFPKRRGPSPQASLAAAAPGAAPTALRSAAPSALAAAASTAATFLSLTPRQIRSPAMRNATSRRARSMLIAVLAVAVLPVTALPASAAFVSTTAAAGSWESTQWAPDTPTGLSADAAGPDAVTVSWDPVTTAPAPTGYQVEYRDLVPGSEWNASPPVTSPPTTIGGLQQSTSYEVRVFAVRDGFSSDPSTPVLVSTDPGVPTVTWASPAAGARLVGTTTFTVNAGPTTTRVGYTPGDGPVVSSSTSPTFPAGYDTTGRADGPVTVVARAENAVGDATEASRTFQIDNVGPVSAFTAPAADASVANNVTVSSTATDPGTTVQSVAYYAKPSAQTGNGTQIAVDTVAPYSAVWDSRTVANGGYTLTAVTTSVGGRTVTTTRAVTVANALPAAPVVTAAATVTTANLSWTSVSGAQFYRVYRCTSTTTSTCTAQVGGDIVGTTASQSGLARGTTYFYSVRAFNGAGTGPFATVRSTVTAPPDISPNTINLTTFDNSTVVAEWARVASATGYELQYRQNANGETGQWFSVNIGQPPSGSVSAGICSGLQANVQTQARARATNAAGASLNYTLIDSVVTSNKPNAGNPSPNPLCSF